MARETPRECKATGGKIVATFIQRSPKRYKTSSTTLCIFLRLTSFSRNLPNEGVIYNITNML